MAMQLKQYEEDSKMNQSISDALLKEKMAVSADQRKADMKEREILMGQGNVLAKPTDYESDSILLERTEDARAGARDYG